MRLTTPSQKREGGTLRSLDRSISAMWKSMPTTLSGVADTAHLFSPLHPRQDRSGSLVVDHEVGHHAQPQSAEHRGSTHRVRGDADALGYTAQVARCQPRRTSIRPATWTTTTWLSSPATALWETSARS